MERHQLMGLLTATLLGLGVARAPAAPPSFDLPTGRASEVVLPEEETRDDGAPDRADAPLQFHDLANGLSVVLQSRRAVPSVAVQLWIRMGLADEGPGERGALSIGEELLRLRVEQLLASGSPTLRAALPSLRVQTTRDATVLGLEAPRKAFDGILRILAAATRAQGVHPERFETARALAGERLRHQLHDGDAVTRSALASLAYRVHPYRNQPLGSLESLSARTAENLSRFLARELRPENSWLVVVGAVGQTEAARAVIREFGPWPTGRSRSFPKIIEPKMMSVRQGTLEGPDASHRLALGFPAPPYRGEDAPAVALLARALDPSSGTSVSRLLLRSLPPGTHLESEYVPARDPSLLTLTLTAPTLQVEAAEEAIHRTLAGLRKSGLPDPDLALAKRSLTNLALARSQGYAQQARALGLAAILSSPEPPYPILEKVQALSSNDVQQAALAYLDTGAHARLEVLPASQPRVEDAEPRQVARVRPQPDGSVLARSEAGPDGIATVSLRLRLKGLPLRPGDLGLLRDRLRAALVHGPGTNGWWIDSPLPGLDRDGLSFAITASTADLPRALEHLTRTVSSDPLETPPNLGPGGWEADRDRAIDHALALLLEEEDLGVRRYPDGPHATVEGSEGGPARLRQLRDALLRPERIVLAAAGEVPDPLLEEARERLLRPEGPAASPPRPADATPRAPVTHRGRGDEGAVVLAALVPSSPDVDAVDAAHLLAEVLGGGAASRLGRRLREVRSLGFEVGARATGLDGGPAVLVAWIGCNRETEELAELVLREEVTRLTLEPVSTAELVSAREALRARSLARRQSTLSIAADLARAAQRGRTDHVTEAVDALTLQELARACFSEARIESFAARLTMQEGRSCADPACGPAGSAREN